MKKGFRILKFKKDKPIFEVKDVSKSFDGRPILKKLSIKVFPGECVGLRLAGRAAISHLCANDLIVLFQRSLGVNVSAVVNPKP